MALCPGCAPRLIEAGYALDGRDTTRTDIYGLAIELKLKAGLRLGELLGGRYGDIDHAEGVWNVRAQWTRDGRLDVPKTKKSVRRIPLSPDMLRKIAARKLRNGAGATSFCSRPATAFRSSTGTSAGAAGTWR